MLMLKVQKKLKLEARVMKNSMLFMTADGHKLPPYIILSRKVMPKNGMFPKDIYAWVGG
jgi:hypothetical protein